MNAGKIPAAAVWLRRPGDCKSALLPSVGGRVTASADGVVARRITVTVCTPDKLS
jgi:hypothetical protein